MRSFSAQRYDEKDIKRTILDYQNNYKEMKKYYNNISGKKVNLIPKKVNLSKSNVDLDTKKNFKSMNFHNNKKIIVINKFSSSSLFRKSANRNTISKMKVI